MLLHLRFLSVYLPPCLAVAQTVLPWPNAAADFAVGYNTLKGEVRGRCLAVDPKAPKQVSGEGVRFALHSVENESQLYSEIGLSGSAKYSVFKGQASFVDQVSINKYSSYFYISITDEVRTESINEHTLQEPDVTLSDIEALKSDPREFINRCGDKFVVAASFGGEYISVVEIQTTNEHDKQTVDAQISGSAGAFSGSAEAQGRLEKITSNRNVRVFVIRGGGAGPVVTTSQALTQAVTSFPSTVENMPSNNLKPFRITLMDYTTLHSMPKVDAATFNFDKDRLFIDDASSFVEKVDLSVSNTQYVLKNADQFEKFDATPLKTYLLNAANALRDVRIAIGACLESTTGCGKFSSPNLVEVTLPSRINGPTREELLATIAASRAAFNNICGSSNIFSTSFSVCAAGGIMNNPQPFCATALQVLCNACRSAGCLH